MGNASFFPQPLVTILVMKKREMAEITLIPSNHAERYGKSKM